MKYSEWKAQLVENPSIMGGETCFPNSRLTVKRIGEALKGETIENILEDYPYLTEQDCEYARKWIMENKDAD